MKSFEVAGFVEQTFKLKNMEQGFNDKYRKRTKDLCIGVIRMLPNGKRSEVYKIFSKQLIRSISSVAANFRATCRAKSNNDYIYKLAVVIEELDESQFWLEMLIELKEIENQKALIWMDEISNILAVFTSLHHNKKMNNLK